MSSSPPTAPGQTSSDIDLYCLKCGYNLRGLSGDPRRCPECFYMNPMGDLELPAALIKRQLERMETAPTVCIVCFVFVVLSLALFVTGIPLCLSPSPDPSLSLCSSLPLLGSLAGWVASTIWFRDSCLGKEGWSGVFLRFHASGLALIIAIIAAVVALNWLLYGIRTGPSQQSTHAWACILGTVVLVALVGAATRFLPRISGWAKEGMEQLQREVAVQIARDRLRRDLASGKR